MGQNSKLLGDLAMGADRLLVPDPLDQLRLPDLHIEGGLHQIFSPRSVKTFDTEGSIWIDPTHVDTSTPSPSLEEEKRSSPSYCDH